MRVLVADAKTAKESDPVTKAKLGLPRVHAKVAFISWLETQIKNTQSSRTKLEHYVKNYTTIKSLQRERSSTSFPRSHSRRNTANSRAR